MTFESLGYIEPSNFSDGLNLLKEVGVSVIFVLFVLDRFTPDLSRVFKLTKLLESTVPERMSTISLSRKSKKFSFFISTPETQEWYDPSSALSNSKET